MSDGTGGSKPRSALGEFAGHVVVFAIALDASSRLMAMSGRDAPLWSVAAVVMALSLVRDRDLRFTGPSATGALVVASLLVERSSVGVIDAVLMAFAFIVGAWVFKMSQRGNWPGSAAEVAWFSLTLVLGAPALGGLLYATAAMFMPDLATVNGFWDEVWRQMSRDATAVVAFGPLVIGQIRGRHKEHGPADWALTLALGAFGGTLAYLSPSLMVGSQPVLSLAAVPAAVTAFALGRMPTYVVVNMTGAGGTLGYLTRPEWGLEIGLATFVISSALVVAIASLRDEAGGEHADDGQTTVEALHLDLPTMHDHRRSVAATFRMARIVALVAVTIIEVATPSSGDLPTFLSLPLLGVLFLGPNALSLLWDRNLGQRPRRIQTEVALDSAALIIAYGLLVDGPTSASFPLAVALATVMPSLRLPPRTAAAVAGTVTATISALHAGVVVAVMPAVPGHDLFDILGATAASVACAWVIAGIVSSLAELHLRSRDAAMELDVLHSALQASRASLEHFANVVAHDVRGPITTAIQVAEAIEMLDLPPEKSKELALTIAPSLRRTVKLVDRLHEHARASTTPLQLADTDLGELAQRVIEDNEAGIQEARANVRLSGKLPTWSCDEVLIEQVLGNLIRNALRHARTPENPSPLIEIRAIVTDGSLRLTVADDGPGIADALVDTLFEEGTTTTPGDGLGLGLSTSLAVAQRHEGTLEVTRSRFGGAAMHLVLPSRDGRSPENADPNAVQTSVGDRHVLIDARDQATDGLVQEHLNA